MSRLESQLTEAQTVYSQQQAAEVTPDDPAAEPVAPDKPERKTAPKKKRAAARRKRPIKAVAAGLVLMVLVAGAHADPRHSDEATTETISVVQTETPLDRMVNAAGQVGALQQAMNQRKHIYEARVAELGVAYQRDMQSLNKQWQVALQVLSDARAGIEEGTDVAHDNEGTDAEVPADPAGPAAGGEDGSDSGDPPVVSD